jgi:hypothetical protein
MIILGYIAFKVSQIKNELRTISNLNSQQDGVVDSFNNWIENLTNKRDPNRCCIHDQHENYCVCCMNEHEKCRIQD